MDIDAALVLRVANLANLHLDERETKYYQEQLKKILGYVDQLNAAAITMAPAAEETRETPLRADIVCPSLESDVISAQAPQISGTAFQVPRIVE